MLSNLFKFLTRSVPVALIILFPMASFAQDNANTAISPYAILRYTLIAVNGLLLIVLAILAFAVLSTGKLYVARKKEEKAKSNLSKQVTLLLLLGLTSTVALAQETAATPVKAAAFQLPVDISILIGVLLLQLILILAFIRILWIFLDIKKKKLAFATDRGIKIKSFFQRVNSTVALEDEESIDMQHDYDGIRELDNKIPTWWLYSFYGTIVISVIYIYRMFVTGTLPDQFEELEKDKKLAAVAHAAYLKQSADNVDENTVVFDAAAIPAGQALFTSNCVACHGEKGEGNAIGPNLTDDYWLHKGGIKDIFYSIKYGWPEKGMMSWKGNFSPTQIAELSSYIKSLKGSNPPGAKEAQGELYTEEESSAAETPVAENVQ